MKRFEALMLGRKFKTQKFTATVNVAVSRISVLNKQQQARLGIARSDVIQLLRLNNHESALLRVDQVIKGQNMLDGLVILEGYCHSLLEMVNLIEKEKVCPEELEDAAASLIFASVRLGQIPELQEIRKDLESRFGKDFASAAMELRNQTKVNLRLIQKLSTKQSSLEDRMKILKEIAAENGIAVKLDEPPSEEDKNTDQKPQGMVDPRRAKTYDDTDVEQVLESVKGSKYKDVADAAQAAFESAAYAAAAARAAVELSRSGSFDPDDKDSPSSRATRKVNNFRKEPIVKSEIQTDDDKDPPGFKKTQTTWDYESEDEAVHVHVKNTGKGSKLRNAAEFERSVSGSSSDSRGDPPKNKQLGKGIVFDDSDEETGNEHRGDSLARDYLSDEKFALGSQASPRTELGFGNPKSHTSGGSRVQDVQLNLGRRPISVRTQRFYRQ